jgi:transcriptional regulator with XRE-family HTH domain
MAAQSPPKERYVLNVSLFNQVMRKHGWTSNGDCAEALNMHHSAIARLRAKQTTPSYRVAREMSEYLDIPHDLLFIPEEES